MSKNVSTYIINNEFTSVFLDWSMGGYVSIVYKSREDKCFACITETHKQDTTACILSSLPEYK